ncbi:MAG: haloacid dehalogenase [Calditrichaeota bacterium]|nr:MAG: haloacid dehalogenase [Calditrichota bacterium]
MKNLGIWKDYTTFVFDCDSTLSKIEGIDELARMNGVFDKVAEMTNQAMNSSSLTTGIYEKRLELTKPTKQQIQEVGKLYIEEITKGTKQLIEFLLKSDKEVFILSGGLLEAIFPFSDFLGIKRENVFAVPIYFNEDGTYKTFDKNCPLAKKNGKTKILQERILFSGKSLLIGDGMSDAETKNIVTTFVGFGGVVKREKVKAVSEFYLESEDLSDFLTLA